MNQKIFQIKNLHFYFRIFFNDNKLYDLSFTENKNDLMERQLSLKIANNSPSKFAKEVPLSTLSKDGYHVIKFGENIAHSPKIIEVNPIRNK